MVRTHKRLSTVIVLIGAIWMILAYTFALYGALYLDLPQLTIEQREQATLYGMMGILFGFAIGTGGMLMLKYRMLGGTVTLVLTLSGFALHLISVMGVILPAIGGILAILLQRRKIQQKNNPQKQ